MKKRNRCLDIQRGRDNDLMSAFREVYSSHKKWVRLDRLMSEVVNHKSNRFWISTERATDVISHMKKGETISYMLKNRQRMFNEIYRRVSELESMNKDSALCDLVDQVIYSEAPCFYMTPESAIVIINRLKKRKRCALQK